MRYITPIVTLLLSGLVLAEPPQVIDEFTGKVVGVTDSDTITVLVNKATIIIRLAGIDAPESTQSFGKKSKTLWLQ